VQVERQRREARVVVGAAGRHEVAVQEPVRLGPVPPLGQVHEQERQVVEQVAGGDGRVELDGVEQRGPPLEQDDVAEVQVAMAAAHVAGGRAHGEQGPEAPEAVAGRGRERGDGGIGGERRRPAQGRVVLPEVLPEVGDPARPVGRWRGAVGGGHRHRERIDLGGRQRAPGDDAVEGRRLVEAPHAEDELQGGPRAAEREAAVRIARHRHDGLVHRRGQRPVDGELRLEGSAPAVQRAVVEERVHHRPLQLVGHGPRQHHDGAVGVDPDRRGASVRGRRQQEREDLGLPGGGFGRHGHGSAPGGDGHRCYAGRRALRRCQASTAAAATAITARPTASMRRVSPRRKLRPSRTAPAANGSSAIPRASR
jgi:hypothetical protein